MKHKSFIFRLSADEHSALEQLAKADDCSAAEWIRRQIRIGKGSYVFPEHVLEELRKIRNATFASINNLNQIAHHLNQEALTAEGVEYITPQQIQAAIDTCAELKEPMKRAADITKTLLREARI